MRPAALIAAAGVEHGALLGDLAALTEELARSPSRLPGWSRSHVIAHLANKTMSHARVFELVANGDAPTQFPDGEAAARAEVGRLARTSIEPLWQQLRQAFNRLSASWARLPDTDWGRTAVSSAGERTLVEFVHRHLRDVFVHHVDLDVGYEPSDWPPAFVSIELPKRLADLPQRSDERQLLAWLLGRATVPDLGPW